MGSKRIGLARIERLIENLKRDINLGSSTISGAVTYSGAATFSSTITYASGLKGIVRPLIVSATALSAAGALAAGNRYMVTDTDTAAYTLPAAASSTAGDVIEVVYTAILGNTAVHKYGTAGEFFADTSYVLKGMGIASGHAFAVDTADGAADDFLNLTGATNGGIGIGSTLLFVYNGSKWHVECRALMNGTGNGGSDVTAVFAST